MNQQLASDRKRKAESPADALGFLQEMSRYAADGHAGRVLDAAVDIPLQCLGVNRAVLLTRSAMDDSWTPVCSRNIPRDFDLHCSPPTQSCVLQRAEQSQSPVVIDDMRSRDSACPFRSALRDATSLACIPVVTPGGPPAVLAYSRSDGCAFEVWEIEFLNTIANLTATVLSLNPEERTLGSHLHSLSRLSDTVSTEGEVHEWLDQLLAQILGIMRADSGSVMLSDGSDFRVAASRGLCISDEDHGVHRAKDGSVSGRVIVSRRSLALHGQVGGRHFANAPSRPDVASSISVPLLHKRRLLGILNVNRGPTRRLFSDADLAEALPIAQHLAVGIDNARLYDAARAQTRYFGSLYQIARTISSSLELENVLKMIVRRLRNLVPHDIFGLLLTDQETGQLQLVSAHGIEDGGDQDYTELIQPVARLCSTTHRSVIIREMATHPHDEVRRIAQERGVHSAIVVALVVKRKIVGYLAAYRRDPGSLPRHIAGLLLGLAELAAIAIENARLYERQSGLAYIARRDLVAPSLQPIPGYDIGGKYAPAHDVGGDYYDVIRIDHWRYGLVVADVAGKDVTAALYISMCKHALRALAEHIPSPADLMHKMNRFIHDHTEPEGFISMFYGLLEVDKGMLTYSTAGHEPGLLRRAGGGIEHVRTRGTILGVTLDATFEEETTSIQAGDVLLLYTDGLVQALTCGEANGLDVLKQVLEEHADVTGQGLADRFHEMALSSQSSKSPDDIAIMIVKAEQETTQWT